MIKKSGAFALTVLYTVTIIGFALNFHYCFNHITSVKIDAPAKSCGIHADGKMKCCQDKHFQVKVKDAHQAQSQTFLSKVFGFQLPQLAFSNPRLLIQQTVSQKKIGKDPPDILLNGPAPFLKNCTFLI